MGDVRWTIRRNLGAYLQPLATGRMDAQPLVDREFDVESDGQAYTALRSATPCPIGVMRRYPFADRAS